MTIGMNNCFRMHYCQISFYALFYIKCEIDKAELRSDKRYRRIYFTVIKGCLFPFTFLSDLGVSMSGGTIRSRL